MRVAALVGGATGIFLLTFSVSACLFAPADPEPVPESPTSQSTACGSNDDCGKVQLCEFPEGLCAAQNLKGRCRARPEICTMHWDPVCGCDEKTYSNDCQRQSAGAQKDHDGACASHNPYVR